MGILLGLIVGIPATAFAQETATVSVQLRYADGLFVAGEAVSLQNFLDDDGVDALPCRTDGAGRCSWEVAGGLYQLITDYPLDDISQLSVAEGGLRGLGLTVGQEAIVYHLTVQPDGRVYFDSAPGAAIPVPIIPTLADIQQHILPNPTQQPAARMLREPTPPVSAENAPQQETPVASALNPNAKNGNTIRGSLVIIVFAIGGGLGIGVGLHLWTRQRRRHTHA